MLLLILAFMIGFPVGYFSSSLVLLLKNHKEQISYDINIIKSDLETFHLRFEEIIRKISAPSS